MSAYFIRELVEQVNSQMASGRIVSRVVPSKVRLCVERKTNREISDALSRAWKKNADKGRQRQIIVV